MVVTFLKFHFKLLEFQQPNLHTKSLTPQVLWAPLSSTFLPGISATKLTHQVWPHKYLEHHFPAPSSLEFQQPNLHTKSDPTSTLSTTFHSFLQILEGKTVVKQAMLSVWSDPLNVKVWSTVLWLSDCTVLEVGVNTSEYSFFLSFFFCQAHLCGAFKFYSETCIHPVQYPFHSLSRSFTSLQFYKAFLVYHGSWARSNAWHLLIINCVIICAWK